MEQPPRPPDAPPPAPPSGAARQQALLGWAGIAFALMALACFVGIGIYLLGSAREVRLDGVTSREALLVLAFPPLALFVTGLCCAGFGYLLLNAAGAVGRTVIPAQDYRLVSALVEAEKEHGIELYIRLSSLNGLTGVFTRLGITGLPLATITLTLLFALLGWFGGPAQAKFLDLANLTLGAFLGSYVQRRVGEGAAPAPGPGVPAGAKPPPAGP